MPRAGGHRVLCVLRGPTNLGPWQPRWSPVAPRGSAPSSPGSSPLGETTSLLVARNPDRLAEVATELKDRYGVAVETLSADLGVRDEVLQVAVRLGSTEQPIDLLVNNAGFRVPKTGRCGHLCAGVWHRRDDSSCADLVRGGRADDECAGRRIDHQRVQHVRIHHYGQLLGHQGLGDYLLRRLGHRAPGERGQTHRTVSGYVRTEFHQRASIRTGSIPRPMWVNVDELVSEALADVAKGKIISIPTRRFKVMTFVAGTPPAYVGSSLPGGDRRGFGRVGGPAPRGARPGPARGNRPTGGPGGPRCRVRLGRGAAPALPGPGRNQPAGLSRHVSRAARRCCG